MKQLRNILVLSLMTLLAAACTGKPGADGKSSPPNSNQSSANANASQARAANDNAPPAKLSPAAGTGSIEVTSAPPGARVLLVPSDEGGASEPQPHGITPTTITGVHPGKYTVDLEKPGYRFFQKDIVVKANGTVKVNAALRKK